VSEPLRGHVNLQIDKPIGDGLLHGEALTDCIGQQPIASGTSRKNHSEQFPVGLRKCYTLRHCFGRFLFTLAQTNHFDV
jgi:hypothetical protein